MARAVFAKLEFEIEPALPHDHLPVRLFTTRAFTLELSVMLVDDLAIAQLERVLVVAGAGGELIFQSGVTRLPEKFSRYEP